MQNGTEVTNLMMRWSRGGPGGLGTLESGWNLGTGTGKRGVIGQLYNTTDKPLCALIFISKPVRNHRDDRQPYTTQMLCSHAVHKLTSSSCVTPNCTRTCKFFRNSVGSHCELPIVLVSIVESRGMRVDIGSCTVLGRCVMLSFQLDEPGIPEEAGGARDFVRGYLNIYTKTFLQRSWQGRYSR